MFAREHQFCTKDNTVISKELFLCVNDSSSLTMGLLVCIPSLFCGMFCIREIHNMTGGRICWSLNVPGTLGTHYINTDQCNIYILVN